MPVLGLTRIGLLQVRMTKQPFHGSLPCHSEGACITQWSYGPCYADAVQDGHVIVKSSDKVWSIGEGNDNPLQFSWVENTMDSAKRQKYMKPEGEPFSPRSEGVQYATGKSRRWLIITPERMKQLGQSRNGAQLWMCLLLKVKSNAIKNNIA